MDEIYCCEIDLALASSQGSIKELLTMLGTLNCLVQYNYIVFWKYSISAALDMFYNHL
jgi:hypothetical protein